MSQLLKYTDVTVDGREGKVESDLGEHVKVKWNDTGAVEVFAKSAVRVPLSGGVFSSEEKPEKVLSDAREAREKLEAMASEAGLVQKQKIAEEAAQSLGTSEEVVNELSELVTSAIKTFGAPAIVNFFRNLLAGRL